MGSAQRDDGAQRDREQASEERDREQTSEERDREQASEERDRAGEQRDQAAQQRDHAAERRDQAGERRDHAAERRDLAAGQRDQAAELFGGPGRDEDEGDDLYRSTMARREAASDRRRASQDRLAGARERDQAELDRDTALADRGASAREREYASHDDLTGVYRRGPGFVELDREIVRAKRTAQPLVVAFVDVDHLKDVNDSRGHAAGDRMLVEVADAFRASLRSYDLIIRYGGDEFVCAMSGQTMVDATARVALVHIALEEAPEHGSVTVGLAELQPDDSAETLLDRADAELYRQRQ
ncbi:MAG: diguanylate cyclase [Actinomycetota bacterium]|nr:diguanylate cyclase [Actinomycetota bacterium]